MNLRLFLLLLLHGSGPVRAAPARGLSGPGRFWHITDLHMDPTYQPSQDPTKVCFSSKGVPITHAGLYGDYLCDSPYRLIQSAFSHMASLTQPQDFIIWTGDSPPHVPAGELSTDTVIELISNITRTIGEHFPDMMVYPALGNHDYWPQDQLKASTNDVYKAAAELWKHWLQPEARLTLSQGGFYSQQVKPGLRVVSLNTILYHGLNEVTSNMTDPAGQFEWLEKTLEEAAQSLEKVYIIGHMPVGYLPFVKNITAIRESHNERLVALYRKYSYLIAGHFYGHTHRDSFMVLLDQQDPVASIFVSPAVTPIKNLLRPYSNNPSFRMYLYDTKDYAPLDIWQYHLNLTEANEKQRSDWRLEYIMTKAYGLSDLKPHSLLRLGLSFYMPQTDTFDKYFTHFMVSYDSSIRCEGDCKLNQVCSVLFLDQPSYSRCVANQDP